ncbi:hypothetical protein RHCRD62_20700 [Rhodococcus sp. RD6.2]|nr:hypothetical protein RHCRD62_20700 [Rhodococcus sp. RD6.2]
MRHSESHSIVREAPAVLRARRRRLSRGDRDTEQRPGGKTYVRSISRGHKPKRGRREAVWPLF